jgi:hypothetical protein
MFRGLSIRNDRIVAIRTSAGSNNLSLRVWRRCIFSAWTSSWVRFGSKVGVTRLIANGSLKSLASFQFSVNALRAKVLPKTENYLDGATGAADN